MITSNDQLFAFQVAFSNYNVDKPSEYRNAPFLTLLDKLRLPGVGSKVGSNFLRSCLMVDAQGKCLSRSNTNTESLSRVLIVDCDKRLSRYGELLEGAPCPKSICDI